MDKQEVFITIKGPSKSGKTTLMQEIFNVLTKKGFDTYVAEDENDGSFSVTMDEHDKRIATIKDRIYVLLSTDIFPKTDEQKELVRGFHKQLENKG
jgi:molybdopterin-guanine dinucleotide biosynthesis protein